MPSIIINSDLSTFDMNSLNNQHENVVLMYFYRENNDHLQNNVISNLISDMKCYCTIVKIKIIETSGCYLDQATMIHYNGKHKNNIISNKYGDYVYNDKKMAYDVKV